MDKLPPLRNSLMGSPMFRMGMGILEGATPQATPPNAIRNMMGGLQGASDYRNNETDRLLQRQRMKMDLEQRQRAEEKWKFEKQDLERKEAAMKIWEDKNKQQSLPQIPGQMTPTNGPLQAGATVLDPATQQMMDNYQNYINSLEMKKQMAIAERDFSGAADADGEILETKKAMRDLSTKGMEADRYKHSGYVTSKKNPGRSYGMQFDTYTGQQMVNTPEGRVPLNEAEYGFMHSVSQQDPSRTMLSAADFNKLDNDYSEGTAALDRINNLYRMVEMQDDSGLTRMADGIAAKFKGAYGQEMTPKQMATLLAKGETGKLVGSMRIELFGGGPLTDTEREFAMDLIMGGWTSNKATMKQRLLRIYKAKQHNVDRYGRQLQVQHAQRGSAWEPGGSSGRAVSQQTDFLDDLDDGGLGSVLDTSDLD